MLDVKRCDYLIIGAGVIGLAIANEILRTKPNAKVIVADKEKDSVQHGSGRNSGVIHAGFYYPADSLKAKLTAQGNQELKAFCKQHDIPLNECGKLVVAQSDADIPGIHELARRAGTNGVDVTIVDEKEMAEIEPNAQTCEVALYSPNTASADPAQVTAKMAELFIQSGGEILYNAGFNRLMANKRILLGDERREVVIEAGKVINCAGLYADKIAKTFGFAQGHIIIPFKGIYLKYQGHDKPIKTNIYPVPNLRNPFLGVHYTVTVDNQIKIGPTAIPAFWRENYQGMANFNWDEMLEILGYETRLFASNHFNFRDLALEEMKKYQMKHFRSLAGRMVKEIDLSRFSQWTKPGIRAQLLNKKTMKLEQDFMIEADQDSVHILNAVSPAWTSSLPFARYVVENYIN